MEENLKQLLLIDLCARFPYGVVLDVDTTDWKAPEGHIQVKIEGYGIIFKDMSLIINGSYYGDNYKPYLRPMSSMTEEEEKEYKRLCVNAAICSDYQQVDFLNKHHFDYRGLISKGLALEAPEGMYNFKFKTTCNNCEDKNYCSQSEYVKNNCYKLK